MKKVIESLIKINFIFFIGMIALTLLSIINTNNKIMIYILASSFQLILVSFPLKLSLTTIDSKRYRLASYIGILFSLFTSVIYFIPVKVLIHSSDDLLAFGQVLFSLSFLVVSLFMGIINYLLSLNIDNEKINESRKICITLLTVNIMLILASLTNLIAFEYIKLIFYFFIISTIIILNLIAKIRIWMKYHKDEKNSNDKL